MYTSRNVIWEFPRYSQQEFFKLSERKQLEHLSLFAHLAPSTHNTQPWRFSIDEIKHTITVWIDRHAILPESDVVGRQTIISVGCAIENLDAGARAFGLSPKIDYCERKNEDVFPLQSKKKKNSERYIPIAIITIPKIITSKENTKPDLRVIDAIRERRIMRLEYDPKKPIPKKIIAELPLCAPNSNISLNTITDTIPKLAIAEFQGQADGYVLNSKKFSKELGEWFLPNDTQSGVGMPGDTFGMPDEQALRFHRGLIGVDKLEPEDGLKFSLSGKIGFEKSPMIGLISIEKDTFQQCIDAGRMLERIFLLCTREGISMAINGAIVEVRLVNRMFGAMFGSMRPLAAVFRIGYPLDQGMAKKRPHSPRMPLSDVMIDDPKILG
jgi:hypothetical protein